jgi:hypothetical protein
VTVRVKVGPPAVTEVGEMLVMTGIGLAGGLTVKVKAPDVPPPGVGLKAEIAAEPWVAMSVAGMAAVILVEETNVLVRSTPFQRTFDPGMKLLPVTVRVKVGPPAIAELGEIPVITGIGLAGGLMVKVRVPDAPPPGVGLKTEIGAEPWLAMSAA